MGNNPTPASVARSVPCDVVLEYEIDESVARLRESIRRNFVNHEYVDQRAACLRRDCVYEMEPVIRRVAELENHVALLNSKLDELCEAFLHAPVISNVYATAAEDFGAQKVAEQKVNESMNSTFI